MVNKVNGSPLVITGANTTITITIENTTGKTITQCSRPMTPAQIIVIFSQLIQANAQAIVQSQSMIIKPKSDTVEGEGQNAG